MLLKEDLDFLWEAHERTKEASTILGKIDKCKVSNRARYLRSQVRDSLAEGRRRIKILKKFLEANEVNDKREKERKDMFT